MGTPFFSVKALIDKEGSGGSGTASKSSEIKLVASSTESVGGTASTQEEANTEMVTAIKNALIGYQTSKSYKTGDEAYYRGLFWTSKIDSNKGNEPSDTSEAWERTYLTNFSYIVKLADLTNDYTITNNLKSSKIHIDFFLKENSLYKSFDTYYTVTNDEVKVHFENLPTSADTDAEVLFYIYKN